MRRHESIANVTAAIANPIRLEIESRASAYVPDSMSPMATGASPRCSAVRHRDSDNRYHKRLAKNVRMQSGRKKATPTTAAPAAPAAARPRVRQQ